MFCKYCGTNNPHGTFCKKCGKKITDSQMGSSTEETQVTSVDIKEPSTIQKAAVTDVPKKKINLVYLFLTIGYTGFTVYQLW